MKPQIFSALLDSLYDSCLHPDGWQDFLQDLAAAMGSEQALLFSLNRASGAVDAKSHNLDLNIIQKWEGSVDHVDVWYQHVIEAEPTTAHVYSDLLPLRELKQTGFHSDFLVPLDIQFAMGGNVSIDQESDACLSVFKDRRQKDFDRESVEAVTLLLPHVRRAMAIDRLLSMTGARAQPTDSVLEHFDRAALICAADGNVLAHNAKAEKIFLEEDGLTLRFGQLAAWSYQCNERLRHRLSDFRAAGDPVDAVSASLFIKRRSGKADYLVSFLPVPFSLRRHVQVGPESCLVTVLDPALDADVPVRALQERFGLTPSEGQLCQAFYKTGALAEAAVACNISINTARTHLKRVFQKLDVSSQAQLSLFLSRYISTD